MSETRVLQIGAAGFALERVHRALQQTNYSASPNLGMLST